MFQTTSIGRSTPGSGRRAGLGLDRIAHPTCEASPGVDPDGVLRTSPGSADLAFDEERAWPHAGRPEPLPLIRPWDEKLPLSSVEQEVGVAARQQARGRGSRLGGANGRLVVCEQPLVAERRSDRQKRRFERGERGGPCARARSLPTGRSRQRWSARRCGGGVARDRGRRRPGRPPGLDRPDGRRSCALPADGDGARRRGVPEHVRIDAERAPDLAVRHARSVELGVQLLGDPVGPQAALGAVGIPPQREQREVTLGDDVRAVAGPPQLGERRILPRRRLDPLDARVQREQRRSRHAVLQAGPRRPPQRLRARRHSLVERTDPSSESQNLLPREPQ